MNRALLKRLHNKMDGSTVSYDLSEYRSLLEDIKAFSLAIEGDDLPAHSSDLMQRARSGEPLKSLLPVAFALTRAAVQQILGLSPFDEQLLAAMALHEGKLVEMPTGEGKTLAAVFTVYLNALAGQGVHVLTFNDYLARRDVGWMGPVYEFLGLSVGFIQEGMTPDQRRRAYQKDITYLTAREAGFDFLRDSLANDLSSRVQRPFHMALVDEADSVLLDEARVPLVLAGTFGETLPDETLADHAAALLRPALDFDFDETGRNVFLTDAGLAKAQDLLQCDNLYADEAVETLMRLNCALYTRHLLHRNVDYLVRQNRIELVDEFTGRVADGRRWPDGLQAALEAKEGLIRQNRGEVLNSIPVQHFLRCYPKISGMTATAVEAHAEFHRFYGLDVVVIPPHQPCIRQDWDDRLFYTRSQRDGALLKEILQVHGTGRPVLVGTASVDASERLAQALKKAGVHCQVLNAKNDEDEAKIVAQAGQLNAVTISTHMAGRGTDIRLGGSDEKQREAVAARGGLYVLGTCRHESRRIDRQLRGRAGRQGDPGSSRFFISLEDELFAKYRLTPQWLNEMDETRIHWQIDHWQRIIQGQNLDIKITLCHYSEILEWQRQIHFKRREAFLRPGRAAAWFRKKWPPLYHSLKEQKGRKERNELCRQIVLSVMDRAWSHYLATVTDIREGIHLHRLGGEDPLHQFRKVVMPLFDELLESMEKEALQRFEVLVLKGEDTLAPDIQGPSATWTYLVNDHPFEDQLALKMIGNLALSVGAVMWTPLLVLRLLMRRMRRR